jgi:CDP-glucose 4,6-dehydratase
MNGLFDNIYNERKVLVTGHTGFKGSWLALWLTELGAKVIGYARIPPTEPNHFGLLGLPIHSVTGDLLDLDLLQKTMHTAEPEIIFHLAAQPIVRESYRDPIETYNSNVIGTLHVCEAARKCPSVKAVVAITTDKVYDNREWDWGYREADRLGGFDPYSSSKACAEILLASYRNSFWPPRRYGTDHQVLLASVRAGNVIGGGDWAKDRLIPDIMKSCAAKTPALIRNPSAIRPWQHVLECLSGYLMVGMRLLWGDASFATAFNFGPADSDAVPVEEIVKMTGCHWPTARFDIQSTGGPHEARFLRLDCSKARAMLQWKPVWQIPQAIERTVTWYRDYYERGTIDSMKDIKLFTADARKGGLSWA